MNLIGERVVNVKYGVGTITAIKGGYVIVEFSNKTSKFKYPDAFQKYIVLKNELLQKELYVIAAASVKKKEENNKSTKDQLHREVLRSVEMSKGTSNKKHIKKISNTTTKIKKSASLEANRYASKNIAFKCTFNDGGLEENGIGFIKICSDALINKYAKREGTWCSNWECPCKVYYDGKMTRRELDKIHRNGDLVCYESGMLIDWKAQAGTYRPSRHSEEIRLKIKNAYKNSLAVLTTRIPESKEIERFIFAVFIIADFFEGDEYTTGYVSAHPRYRMMFTLDEGKKLPFWNYHANNNQPSKPLWGTGLFRYIAEDEGVQILNDAVAIKKGTKDEQLAVDFLSFYCDENRLDSNQIGEPHGALTLSR